MHSTSSQTYFVTLKNTLAAMAPNVLRSATRIEQGVNAGRIPKQAAQMPLFLFMRPCLMYALT